MAKTKSRKKRGKIATKIRANVKTIVIVFVLMVVIGGVSFYSGMAVPRVAVSKPFTLLGFPDISDFTNISLTAPHTGVKIFINVTLATEYWAIQVTDLNDNPVYSYSAYYEGIHSTPFLTVPGGCKIQLVSTSGYAWNDLRGYLLVVASGPPFIF